MESDRKYVPMLTSEIGTRINAIAEKAGGKKALAEKAGISESQLHRIVSGESQAKIETVALMARVGQVSIEWLATGSSTLAVGEVRPDYTHAWVQQIRTTLDSITANKDIKNSEMAVYVIRGDAMQPTIRDGAIALVDCRPIHEKVQHDGIYALMIDGQVVAKRLQPDYQGSVWVRSDNQAYKDQLVQLDKIYVYGRIIWVGQEL